MQHFSRRRRLEIMLVLGALAAMGPVALDTYGLALPDVAADLQVEASAAQLTLTTFFLGLGLGQVIAGPCSDVLGRRRPLLAGIALYTFAGVVCASAPSIELLVAARLVQGAAAAAGVVISRAMIKDIYAGPDVARHYSRLFLVMGVTPIVAPLIGAQMLDSASWRGIFVLVAAFGVILFAAAGLRLPETLPAARRRSGGVRETIRTFRRLLAHRAFVGYATVFGLGTGAILALVAASPFVVRSFGRSTDAYAFLFLSGAVTLMLVTNANARLVRRHSSRRLLFLGLAATPLAGIGLLTIGGRGFWWYAPCFVVLWMMWGLVPANVTALALEDHAAVAGSAAALLGFTQYGIGAFVLPLAGELGDTARAVGVVVLATGLGALALTIATVAGERSRARTPFPARELAESQTLSAP